MEPLQRRGDGLSPPCAKQGLATSDIVLFHELTHALHVAENAVAAGAVAAPAIDAGVSNEEYATTGLGAWAADAITENAYRAAQRARLGASMTTALYYPPRVSYRGSVS
jgi:hypothetical protein